MESISEIGMDEAVDISVTDGIYATGGRAYTNAAGTVEEGDQVRVQLMAADTFATITDAHHWWCERHV